MVGNVKPIEERSQNYGVMDLSTQNPQWSRLSPEESGADPTNPKELHSTEISDVAFQAKESSSIISLNSACRPPQGRPEEKNLKELTGLLFMGISDLTLLSEREILVQNHPALESTIQGSLQGEKMMLRTVVLRHGECTYDLIYMSKPRFFQQNETDFAHFVDSLRLK